MDKVNGKLTVYFEDPFWVGVFERIENGKLTVAKVTFGAEPKDYEIQEYIQRYNRTEDILSFTGCYSVWIIDAGCSICIDYDDKR